MIITNIHVNSKWQQLAKSIYCLIIRSSEFCHCPENPWQIMAFVLTRKHLLSQPVFWGLAMWSAIIGTTCWLLGHAYYHLGKSRWPWWFPWQPNTFWIQRTNGELMLAVIIGLCSVSFSVTKLLFWLLLAITYWILTMGQLFS